MINRGQEPNEVWRDRCAMRFIQVCLNNPEPDEWFDEWAAAAVQVLSDAHMFYAYKTWREIRRLNAHELEMDRLQLQRITDALDLRNPD